MNVDATAKVFDVEQIIRNYLPQVAHLSLATCADNRPWVCEVHFAYDDQLNLYFCSSLKTRHSTEIRQNQHVAGNIVTQHFLNQKVRGVYFEGTAEQLENIPEDHPAIITYAARLGAGPQLVQAAKNEGSARFHKITVSDFYLLDAYEHTPPRKFHLPWNKATD